MGSMESSRADVIPSAASQDNPPKSCLVTPHASIKEASNTTGWLGVGFQMPCVAVAVCKFIRFPVQFAKYVAAEVGTILPGAYNATLD